MGSHGGLVGEGCGTAVFGLPLASRGLISYITGNCYHTENRRFSYHIVVVFFRCRSQPTSYMASRLKLRES
ncbi:uncharacterized protein DS421_20g685440 [Arachis hypogaea]|nr:uncharacterized protein DS421_20g685440 [Arachis hypogaea]